MKDISEYEDIIDLPHPVSEKHKKFTMEERAAQFAPFAALKGHDEQMAEAAKANELRMESDLEREVIYDDIIDSSYNPD